MRQLIFFSFIFFLGRSLAQSYQGPVLKLDEQSFNFGNVKIKSKTMHEFYYTNIGRKSLKLLNFTSSCGCTTPKWDSLPIQPGQKGKITVTFECFPIEKTFSKTISIESNTDPSLSLIEINGTCIDPYKDQKERYNKFIGSIGFVNTHIDFDKVYNNVTLTQKLFYFFNNSDDTIRVSGFITPEHILCAASPDVILPHQEGSIITNYNANLNSNFGFGIDRIKMLTNDIDLPEKNLVISSTVMEFFDTTQINNSSLFLSENSFDFGDVKLGSVKVHTFEIRNQGTDTLFIRKVRSTCGCLEAILTNYIIAPGRSGFLKLSFNTAGASMGSNSKIVTLISSDPRKPMLNIGVNVNIK